MRIISRRHLVDGDLSFPPGTEIPKWAFPKEQLLRMENEGIVTIDRSAKSEVYDEGVGYVDGDRRAQLIEEERIRRQTPGKTLDANWNSDVAPSTADSRKAADGKHSFLDAVQTDENGDLGKDVAPETPRSGPGATAADKARGHHATQEVVNKPATRPADVATPGSTPSSGAKAPMDKPPALDDRVVSDKERPAPQDGETFIDEEGDKKASINRTGDTANQANDPQKKA